MPCEIVAGSCSLCPWCGEEQCPHLHDNNRRSNKRYWVYATDRRNGYHVRLRTFNDKEDVIAYVKTLVDRKWGKDYMYAEKIDRSETVRGHYKFDEVRVPYVEITITDGEHSWYDSVDLLINTDGKTISYYNKWKTDFHPYVDKHQKMNVEIIKPWDEKLEFINMRDLPWYPTKEEWEAKRGK